MRKRLSGLIIVLLLAACQPATDSLFPTEIPFPTVTAGQRLSGVLPSPGARIDAGSNPATAAAVAARPTGTPDSSACPAANADAELPQFPNSRVSAIDALLIFLNSGGTVDALSSAVISQWEAFGENGYLIDEEDLTGEGTPELIMGYIAPGDVGTLLIFGCQGGRYVQLYEAIADGLEPPQILTIGDTNNNPPAEVVFVRRQCNAVDACEIQTQIIHWEYTVGRFVNILPDPVYTIDDPDINLPQMRDMDNDEVDELVINLESNGNAATGPLRTGVNIYDWNGQFYVLSIIQLDPPRYRIQVVHEGDRAFSFQRMDEALEAYQLALDDPDLRYWFDDGPVNVTSYALYRMILAYAYLGDGTGLLNTVSQMQEEFPPEEGDPPPEAPVYVEMANRFVDTLTITNDLHESCLEVLSVIAERPEALDFVNRYGQRSPTYTPLELCPF